MNKVLKCIIVDDEPLAQGLIEKFIDRVPYLSLLAKYDNAVAAIDGVIQHKPDIIFLDINMPEMTGIEFLSSLNTKRPYVVMISAYAEYALEGYEHDVADYLLKPVSFSRFMKAINKVLERANLKTTQEQETGPALPAAPPARPALPGPGDQHQPGKEAFFMVKEDKKLLKVNISDIVFVEGMKDYVKIHLVDKFIVTHITMTKIEENLAGMAFIRINRSFIVQLAHIRLIEGNMVETSTGKKLPVGINYRDVVREIMQTRTI